MSAGAGRARASISSHLPYLPFIALAAWIFGALGRVFALRLGYPLDLEWMEGGVLTHALRLSKGQPLYAEPSVDFVSFLYTPLYPAVLAALSKVFGLSYTLFDYRATRGPDPVEDKRHLFIGQSQLSF